MLRVVVTALMAATALGHSLTEVKIRAQGPRPASKVVSFRRGRQPSATLFAAALTGTARVAWRTATWSVAVVASTIRVVRVSASPKEPEAAVGITHLIEAYLGEARTHSVAPLAVREAGAAGAAATAAVGECATPPRNGRQTVWRRGLEWNPGRS